MIDWTTLESAGLIFKTGKTYTLSLTNQVCAGFITSSQSTLWATIVLPKPVYGATTVSITKMIGSIRTVSGQYITGGQYDWSNKINHATLNGVNVIQIDFSVSGLTNIPTNNTPVALSIEGDFTLSFS